MSQENVEIVQRAFEIFNRYGETDLSWDEREKAFDAFAKLATPDFEYVEPPEWPGAGVHRGLDQYRHVLEGFFEALSQMTAEVEETFDAGDRVVVFVRWRARGTSSGVALEMKPGQVFTLRAGKLAKQEIYLNRNAALEAAGLSE
jgi:ketosteroid isomerase-like protein